MIILLLFAFLAGIVTTLSPCILPVLPLLLSAGIGQGRYRPYGIIIGLIISFTFFTLALTTLVHITGVSPNILRYISIGLIIFFGLTMIFPQGEKLFTRLLSPLVRLGNRVESSTGQVGTGFVSGFILGIALGLIWAPCAGPILAAITTLVALGSVTWGAVVVTLAYSIGTALPMFFIIYGGNKIASSMSLLTPYTELIRKIFGVLMIIGALAIAFHIDVVLQQIAVKYFPIISIEDNPLVKKELDILQKGTDMNNLSPEPIVNGQAPDFVEIEDWINSPALSIKELEGKVVLVDFWTYSCINCVRTLPYLKKWYALYKEKGLVIVGIHTPEFEFEKNPANVKDAIKRFEITYPVGLDNNYSTWKNYHNRYWPAHYLIDQQGIIRYIHFGEGEYVKTENMIRMLLGLAPHAENEAKGGISEQTPEIYLGFTRAQHYRAELTLKRETTALYDYHSNLGDDEVGLKGDWLVSSESITAKSNRSVLTLNFIAQHVYLVMSSPRPAVVKVFLDDKPIAHTYYTKDMNDAGEILVNESRMYEIIALKNDPGRHLLTVQVPENVSLYAFTFGS